MSYAVLVQMCGESLPEPSSMFDSTHTAELVALCRSFLPGQMAPFSDPFTCVFMDIAKALKMLQCVAISAAPQRSNLFLLYPVP